MLYAARTTRPTPVSLSNHSYWKLSGSSRDVRGHTLALPSSATFNPGNACGDGIPTGEFRSVATGRNEPRSPWDLRVARCLGEAIDALAAAQPHWPHGEQYVVEQNLRRAPDTVARTAIEALSGGGAPRDCLPLVAVLRNATSPSGGAGGSDARASGRRRTMRVYSSEPCLQTYYSTLLAGTVGKGAQTYPKHAAVCLEAQRFADAENGAWPSRILRVGEEYRQATVHEFCVE
jgi:aldose 1-epimerase